MTANRALADRIEQAEGPSRELDAEIYEAKTGKCPHLHIMTVAGDGDGWGEVCSRCCEEEPDQPALRYTASIDAALTLVPEGWNPVEVLLGAIDNNRHETEWVKHLPRYICAAALRTGASQCNRMT